MAGADMYVGDLDRSVGPLLPIGAYGSRVGYVDAPPSFPTLRDQENRIRVAIDDLVEFLNVMGAD